ncbi:carboxymuconolactone decarboxylase family protein [Phenylobacterium aquaticum]|uniref:carboxymuconolactone decarboxylase family protein n=1 Tax=Phenylobacterium aquaticum TaxID=1763816 RepID=UPI001F5E0610|nr:carboxymuconolactone decarboxylase family protein [Phenylobacterium aquaticum]MCI3134771.1 carboxymuconolactone decarboxylase family protein [Phenylobacterium aquaticum]
MTTRINAYQVAPQALEPMMALEAQIAASGLETSLIELVKFRASQINGCAFCLHMHSRDARAAGEREERLHLIAAWRESSYYTAREQAALGWTEALTLVAQTAAPDEAYLPLKAEFTDEEIVHLTLLITTINAWNRLAVGLRFAHPKAWKAA